VATVTTVAEALRSLGVSGHEPPSRPVALRGPSATFVPVAIVGPDLRPEWRGVWIEEGQPPRFLGPPTPVATVTQRAKLTGPTASLVDLLEASVTSLIERAEEVDQALQRLEGLPSVAADTDASAPRPPAGELRAASQALLTIRRHAGRLVSIMAELGGPIGMSFPDLGRFFPILESQTNRLQNFALMLQGSFRDILLTRSAEESNRISAVANQLGATSNRIASIANTSNIRMLGIAYLALVVALIGASLLIPETAATILSMPSATWVPGTWVTLILIVTTAVPLAVIFTRPWVIAIIKGLGTIEARSGEGIRDLPETDPTGAPTLPALAGPKER
jgi:hypothetical protein